MLAAWMWCTRYLARLSSRRALVVLTWSRESSIYDSLLSALDLNCPEVLLKLSIELSLFL